MATNEAVSSCSKIYVEVYPPSSPSGSAWLLCFSLLLAAQNLFEKMHV
jgi:hypothetical protein